MTKLPINENEPETCGKSQKSTLEKPNLDGDRLNLCFLILLYIIQGFPIGLSIAFPIILQNRPTVTYGDQAAFSVTSWPYSMKILWAPVIDALYVQLLGRRKSWLLPLQFIMGFLLFYLASNIDNWLPESGKPDLTMLVFVVFSINFISATQDIVVDGWSLTMVKKKNVGYVSTCNSLGVPIGMFIGSVCFTLLVSEKFGNKYFGTTAGTGGLITMKSFFNTSGIIVCSITALVGVLKKENDDRLDDEKISVFQNYKVLWDILKLPRIRVLGIALLTAKFGFVGMDSVTKLKIIDVGLSKDDVMMMTTAMYAIQFTMPIFVSKYIAGPNPMSYYIKITPIRILWAIAYVALIYFTPSLIHKNEVVNVPLYYYLVLGLIFSINEMMNFFMLLALFAFFCRLSDPRFGGTYMTIYNSFYYFGFLMSNTILLKLTGIMTFKVCSNDAQNTCSTQKLKDLCGTNGGICEFYVDGYYITMAICMITGFVWYGVFKNIIQNYQSLSDSDWLVNVKCSNIEEVNEPCIIIPA